MKKKRLGRTTKYLISVGILIIVFNAILGCVLTNLSARAMKSLINSRMLDISNTAAAMLDGDVLEKLRAEDEDTPEYQNSLQILRYFQDNIELEYIYGVKSIGNRQFIFTIDPAPKDPGYFGQPIVFTDALYRASLGKASVDLEPYEDEWGRFYSAYSPVFNSKHQVAGIVAVDFSAEWYGKQVGNLKIITFLVIATAMIFSAVIIINIMARYNKYYALLHKEISSVSAGIEKLVREVIPEVGDSEPSEEEEEKQPETDNEILALSNELEALHKRLGKQLSLVHSRAYVDGLTGVFNRGAYTDRLKTIGEQIVNGEASFSVAVFDVNQLKTINDDFGHEVGDRIIISAAKAIRISFFDGTVYRIGGDEFVVILDKNSSPEDYLERLRRNIKDINEKAGKPELAISLGYATFNAAEDTHYNSVFNRADAAMYEDKKEFYKTHEDRRKKR